MNCFDIQLEDGLIIDFFTRELISNTSYEQINIKIYNISGVCNFFNNQQELNTLKEEINRIDNIVEETNRRAYGDFQTNANLAHQIVKNLVQNESVKPSFLLEPTCGKGAFILAGFFNHP